MFLYQTFPVFWLIGVLSSVCVCNITIPTSPKDNLVAKIVSNFTMKFILNETAAITIMSMSSTRKHDLLHQDIISSFIMLNNGNFMYRIIGQDKRYSRRLSFYLFLIETHENFVHMLASISQKGLRVSPPQYYLTIVTRFDHPGDTFLNDLFVACFDRPIVRMNFLIPQNQSAWLMTTFEPFVKSCNSLRQRDIALLTEQNYSLTEPLEVIYPRKMKDFRQCPIIVAVFNTPPFIIIKSEKFGNITKTKYDGIDTRILEQLANKFNFKLIYRQAADNQKRGTIYPNGTTTGCIKMVVDKEANFTLGAFMTTPSRSLYMTPSESYMQVTLGFAVLPSEDISTALERLLAPFSPALWYSTGMFIGLAMIVISFTKKLTRRQRHFVIGGYLNRTPILNMWNTFLGGGIGNPRFARPRYWSTFARSLLMIWLISCLILRGSYQGALYDFLQQELLSSPYDTISKINRSDCNLVVMSTATTSLDKLYFPRSRHLVYNYSQQEVFRQVYDRELSGAVYCNDLQMKHFNLLNSPRRVFQMTKDRLSMMNIVIFYNNVSILRPFFDTELIGLIDNGLIEYWTRAYVDERTLSERLTQRVPKKLTMKNVFAIFQISIGLLFFCCFVFLLEKLSTRFVWLKSIVDCITY